MNVCSPLAAFLLAHCICGCSGADGTVGAGLGEAGATGTTYAPPQGAGDQAMTAPTSSTGGETNGAAGDGGTTTVAIDPDIAFDWPEAVEQAGPCEPGTYSGTFECDMPVQGATIEFTGPVEFTLEPSANGEFLEIRDGHLTAAIINGTIPMQGDLEGRLDCSTNGFTATIIDGTYTVFIFMGPFEGSMTGTLDRSTNTLSGIWSLNDANNPMTGCTGPWTAVKEP
jgi:hypothetical protein